MLSKFIGGLFGDAVEAVKYVAEEVSQIPSELAKGFEQGSLITPEGAEQPAQAVIDDEVNTESEAESEAPVLDIDEQIAELKLKMEALESSEPNAQPFPVNQA